MKQLFEYLLSKQTSKDSHKNIQSDLSGDWVDDFGMEFPDDKKPRFDKKGKALLWWKSWVILKKYGPMPKKEILRNLGLKETSYATMFAELSIMNIIVPNKKTKKLEPIDPSEWKVTKKWVEDSRAWHGGYWTYQ